MKFFLSIYLKGLFFFITNKYFRIFFYYTLKASYKGKTRFQKVKFLGEKLELTNFRSFTWQYNEIFFKKFYDFMTDKDNPIIIDCGSNIGLSIINFKKQYPNSIIHSFEADKFIYSILKKNIEIRAYDSIFLHNQAVWDQDTQLTFLSDGIDGGKIDSIGSQNKDNVVEAIDFNEYLNQFECIDFLKMDIEGAETTVIPHIADNLKKVKNLFVEFHSFNGVSQNLSNIISTLESKGFRLFIENPTDKIAPFINQTGKNNFDLQINIFAYRI